MNQKGFVNIILVVVIVILAGAIGYLALIKIKQPTSQPPAPSVGQFSLDNGLIVASMNGQIVTVRADGTEKKTVLNDGFDNQFPAWSWDGKKIAYSSIRQGHPQIFIIDADGSNLKQLTQPPHNAFMPSWSHDDKMIIFSSTDKLGTTDPRVWVMNANGSNQKPLTQIGLHGAISSFSPDDKTIIYIGRVNGHNEIFSMNADGSNAHPLTFPTDPKAPDANAVSWSPDGKKLAFFCGQEGSKAPEGHDTQQVCLINADGSNRQQFTKCTYPSCIASDNPHWSPDGTMILYDRGSPDPAESGVWIMNLDGTNNHQLLPPGYSTGRRAWKALGTN